MTATPVGCGAGCSRLDFGAYWAHDTDSGWSDAAGHYVHLAGGDPSGAPYVVDAIVRTDARTVFAVRYPPGGASTPDEICWSHIFAVGEGFVAFDVYWGAGPDLSTAEDRIYYAPLTEIATVADPMRTVTVSGPAHVEYLAASERAVVWEMPAGAAQGMIDGTFVDLGYDVHRPRVVGTDVLSVSSSGHINLRAADGTDATLIDFSPRMAAGGALTDGVNVAWFEFEDMINATSVLRAGALARSAAPFTPRVVEGPGLAALAGVIGDGLVAHEEDQGSPRATVGYRVIDLATGHARLARLPVGESASWLYLVSGTELVFETQAPDGYRLYVIDPASLPTVS